MADPNVLNPHPPEFDRFLYASVGEDRNGSVVTVLSTLRGSASTHGMKPLNWSRWGAMPRDYDWESCLLGFGMFPRLQAITPGSHET